jgi:hypothetical protein
MAEKSPHRRSFSAAMNSDLDRSGVEGRMMSHWVEKAA